MEKQTTSPTTRTENQVRRSLQQQGLALQKCRSRNFEVPSHGLYRVIDPNSNTIVAGGSPLDFSMTLADIEGFLSE